MRSGELDGHLLEAVRMCSGLAVVAFAAYDKNGLVLQPRQESLKWRVGLDDLFELDLRSWHTYRMDEQKYFRSCFVICVWKGVTHQNQAAFGAS